MTAAIVWYAKRRPVGTPLTWGEAMVAATYVFLVMFWVYGVVPHQWLAWADNELGWRSDAYLLGPELHEHPAGPREPAVQRLEAGRARHHRRRSSTACSSPATSPSGSMWQGRGDAAARKQKAIEERTSAYGRPLVRKA